MTHANRRLLASATALALAAAAVSAAAETIRLEFADQPTRWCGAPWSQAGLELRMLPLTTGCVAYDTQYGWIVGDACLEIDVSTLGGVSAVGATFVNYDADDGFGLYLLDDIVPVASGRTTATAALDSLTVASGGAEVRRVRVFCYNVNLSAITVEFIALPTEASTWGSIKALYR